MPLFDIVRFLVGLCADELTIAIPTGVTKAYARHMVHFLMVEETPGGQMSMAIRAPRPRPSKSWWKTRAANALKRFLSGQPKKKLTGKSGVKPSAHSP